MATDMDLNYDENSVTAYLKFGSTHLTVDCHNNNIIKQNIVRSITFAGGPTINVGSSLADLSAGGLNIRRLNIACSSCSKYAYLVQVHISLDSNKIVALILNSESASIEDGVKLYEIKNIYTTEKTEMSTFHTHLSYQRGALDKVELPLVPLDLQNPLKTVERIKSLLVFL
jgi:hypothetical protein